MHENFDCTQFLTFDTSIKYEDIIKRIKDIFNILRFKIIESEDIKDVKKTYYREYWDTYYIELEDSEFFGDFSDWEERLNPPLSIVIFNEAIIKFMDILELTNLKVIICSFADISKTKNRYVKVNKNMLLNELFSMSINSFICPDNLIIELYN